MEKLYSVFTSVYDNYLAPVQYTGKRLFESIN